MSVKKSNFKLIILQSAPAILFAVLFIALSILSPTFLEFRNLANIVTQASHVAIIAIGMTFVLLIAGIDLSVGANMYVSIAIMGLFFPTLDVSFSLLVALLFGVVFGAINAFFIVYVRVPAFVTTLATLFIGRGLALYLSSTKMVFAGDQILNFGQGSFLSVPFTVWFFLVVLAIALFVERMTPFGRYLFAIGADVEAAKKAGIPVQRIVFAVYVIAGMLAALGGFISYSQISTASSSFGLEKEFPVIAAVVLGGTSLSGGRGGVLGSAFGAILMQTVQNGLVLLNVNPYFYPLVLSSIIFIAVLIDSLRSGALERLSKRQIRVERTALVPPTNVVL
jgi:ribose/xylose/arabinose/galactoside ABC-type transport system permease subunit